MPKCVDPGCTDKPGPDGFYCPTHQPKLTHVWGYKTPDGEFHPQWLEFGMPPTDSPGVEQAPDAGSLTGELSLPDLDEPPPSDWDEILGNLYYPHHGWGHDDNDGGSGPHIA